MSKTQDFINNHQEHNSDSYEGIVHELTKEQFEKEIEGVKQSQVYCAVGFEGWDMEDAPHPLQRIYTVEEWTRSYDNGAFEFGHRFAFKYKGKYYMFAAYGGN